MRYYSAIKKNDIPSSPQIRMELEVIMLTKISQTKKNQIPCALNSFVETNIQISKKQRQE